MRTIKKAFFLLVLLASSLLASSQTDGCSEYEKLYQDRKDNPILGQQAKEELCNCYLNKAEDALINCDTVTVQKYYKKYKNLSGKTDTVLEQRIYDCQHPPKGTLVINGDTTLLGQSKVRINGDWVSDPTQSQSLSPGKYKLKVDHPDYNTFEKPFSIEKDKTTQIEVKFNKAYGQLKIRSNENWLKTLKFAIYHNGDLVSQPTLDNLKNGVQLECGSYKVTISKGSQQCDKEITISKNTTSYLEVKTTDFPLKYGYLKFEDNTGFLSACSVYVNDERFWNPQESQTKKCGSYKIRITHKDYETDKVPTITIEEEKTVTIGFVKGDDGTYKVTNVNTKQTLATLTPKKCEGFLLIDAGKDNEILKQATVFIGDEKFSGASIVGTRLQRECGSYSIRIEHKDYKTIEGMAEIKGGQTTTFPVKFPSNGYLVLKGDKSLLSQATITIDDKKVAYGAWLYYVLDIGKHKVCVVPSRPHENVPKRKTFVESVNIIGGRTDTLHVDLPITHVPIGIKVNERAEIYVDGEKKTASTSTGWTIWTGDVEKGKHTILYKRRGRRDVVQERFIDESYKIIGVDYLPPCLWFATLNFGYDITSKTRLWGATLGRLFINDDKLGLFLGGMVNYPPKTSSGECDKEGFLIDGSRPEYVDICYAPQWSAIVGLYGGYRDFFLKGGVGLGKRNEFWLTKEDLYYRNIGRSGLGFVMSAGVQYHLGFVVLSVDVETNGFRTADLKFGLGYTF